ncbi:MAG: hypothetical protein K8F91_25140 [Candidatus Obscuribacterales bacterium]|nr:hypothetical protein [Candidatus Obscuribacterales bacterium]
MPSGSDNDLVDASAEKRRKNDFIPLAIVAVILVVATIYLSGKLLDQSEKHLADIKKIHVAGTEVPSIAEKETDSDRQVIAEVRKAPNAEKIVFDYYEMTDDSLAYLASMKQLKTLSLSFTRISDKGLAHLTGLPLLDLSLVETAVTDQGLKELGKINSLRFLDLSATDITDRGLPYLRPLSSLSDIHLTATHITDNGIKELLHHPHLWKVVLINTFVTDASMPDLAKLENLTNLSLDGTEISSKGLACLSKSASLVKLSLENCKISDEDIAILVEGLANLTSLNLSGTQVSDRGVNTLAQLKDLRLLQLMRCPEVSTRSLLRLKKALPDLKIETGSLDANLIPPILKGPDKKPN